MEQVKKQENIIEFQEPVKETMIDDDVMDEIKEESQDNENITEKDALKDIENSKEIPEKEYEEIKTMADFIKMLEDRLISTEDTQEKNAIAYNLLRVKNAFVRLKTKPEKFKIGSTEDGKLSVYNKSVQELRVNSELLELIKDCKVDAKIMRIVFREAELDKNGVSDIGFQQLKIKKLGEDSREYHKKERSITERIFGIEKNVLDLIDKPKEFADFFLKKEIEKRLKQGRKIKAEDLAPYLSKQFKKGAPKLYQKLKASGYGFRTRIKEIISSLEKNI